MGKFYMPLRNLEEWRTLVAYPELQWKDDKSGKELAKAWLGARNGFPDNFIKLCAQNNINKIRTLFAFPEYPVGIRGSIGGSSKTDLLVIAKKDDSLFPIAVEGKAGESFGSTVSAWRTESGKESKNREARLEKIRSTLSLSDKDLSNIRYQLLHRTYSAFHTMNELNTNECMVLIHYFDTVESKRNHAEHAKEFDEFISLFDGEPLRCADGISHIQRSTKTIYFAWLSTQIE